MDSLSAFLGGGGAALLILALVGAEFIALAIRYRLDAGSPPGRWLSPLVAGAALVTALWLVQSQMPPIFLGPVLAIAGVAHLLGFRQRWSREPRCSGDKSVN